MSSLLLVIDLQEAFINENTEYIINRIEDVLNKNQYDNVVFTRFINTPNSIFARDLEYYDCIDEDSKKIVIDTRDNLVIDKYVYTSYCNELEEYIKNNDITDIYLCGIDIDCCVLKTAFDLYEKEYNIFILKELCACTHGENKKGEALEIIERSIGKKRIIS